MSEQKNDAFIHLHVHSVYSLLDGACRIPEMMERLKGSQKSRNSSDYRL